ncbi:Aldo-keto yakc [Apiospora hydei]|uniref:Aldo-keto yakc n=1 Tax=Apiospora hydei TaxID=1337664 RepID=A0ABR1WBS3_9PEZI
MRSAGARPATEGIVNQLEAVAEEKGCSAAHLAVAWVLKQRPDFIRIPATKRIEYLEKTFGVLKVELTDEEEAEEVRRIVSWVAGGRDPDFAKGQCYLDKVDE